MQPFYEKKNEEFRCFFSENMSFPAHLHYAAELIFVKAGIIDVTVNDQTKTLRENEIALIFPETVHSYLTKDHSHSILCIFSPSLTRGYYQPLCKKQPECPFFSSQAYDMDLAPSFDRMLSQAGHSLPISEAWLNLILAFLVPGTLLLPRDSRDNSDISYQLISYISQHFQEPLTLESLADHLHFNKYYISRVFTQKLRCSFYEYVNRLRLDYAAGRLRDTDLHITHIWQEAGFESQKTFNRNFLSCYHMTPSQYRRTQTPTESLR